MRCSSSVQLAGVATANYMCTTCPLDIFAQVMRGGRRKVRAVVVKLEYPVFLDACSETFNVDGRKYVRRHASRAAAVGVRRRGPVWPVYRRVGEP